MNKFYISIVLSLFLLPGCASSVVGLECAADRVLCDGVCVDVSTHPEHCGACGVSCGTQACVDGMCVGGDAGLAEDAGVDAGPPPVPVCSLGEIECGEECVRPDRDPDHCGGCGISCGDGFCVAGSCRPNCDPPLVACGRFCIDLTDDPDHCGACYRSCPSGICVDSMCEGAPAGHIVVIGHDYTANRAGMNRLVGNAVFMAPGSPVRVVTYRADTSGPSATGVDRAVQQVVTERGRRWSPRTAPAERVPVELATADVFLVYPQTSATDAELEALGAAWGTALTVFLERGGVVVVLDGPAAHGGTHQILEAAGLFDAGAMREVSGEMLEVVDPYDPVSLGVPDHYRAEGGSVSFSGIVGDSVVADGTAPVVVHLVGP